MWVRSPEDQPFVNWIGNLSYTPELNGPIRVPPFVGQPPTLDTLIQDVYPLRLLAQAATDYAVFRGRTILLTLNTTVTELNLTILQQVPGESRIYAAVNTTDTDSNDPDSVAIPAEVIDSIDLPGLPPSRLKLQKGVPIILIRNLCASEGLCNGTRIVITELQKYCIQARILGRDFNGNLVTIPRIKLSSTEEDELPFILTRKQFPVRLCFAMTINKSQGQSFEKIGLDLRSPVFTHGQFYVAVSRVTSAGGLSILLPLDSTVTSNIVYPEVLQGIA
jgi:hypothetical protein